MKAILKVTKEEGKKMLEELRNVALEFGWAENVLADSGILQEYGRVIDRAMAVLGFELNIEGESSDDEDEEYDFDDEDELDNCEDYDGEDDEPNNDEFFLDLIEKGYSVEAAQAITDFLFGKCEDEDDDEDEEEDEELASPIDSINEAIETVREALRDILSACEDLQKDDE